MKRLIIAVVILVGLIVVLRWPARKSAPAVTPAVVKFDPGQASRIQVDQSGQPEVILDKVNGQWRIEQPFAAAADAGAVTTLLTTASTIDPAEKLGPQKDLAPFGLTAPATVQVSLSGGAKFSFLFGSNTPTGDNMYLKLASAPDVYTIPTYIKSDMVKSAFDLRDKNLLHFTADKLNSLRLQYQGKNFAFARQSGKWPADQADNIQTLADALSNAQMDALIDAGGKSAAKVGLTHPATVVSLAWDGGQADLDIGNKKGTSEYYARSSESPAIFTINSYLLDDIKALAQPPQKTPAVSGATPGTTPVAQPKVVKKAKAAAPKPSQ